jgi:hypothetical protein
MSARFLAVLFLLALAPPMLAAPAAADERPPRYDLDGLCSRQSLVPEGIEPQAMSRCLAIHGEALEATRRMWPNTPEYIQRDCDQRARVDRDGNYQILENCVRQQLRQQQADQAESTRPKPKPKPAPTPAPN